jgi:predicted Zn-dependent peptidase
VRDAREALRRDHESALAQNGRLVEELADRYENSEDLADFFELPAQYAALTAEAIRDVARRCLDTANYVRVTLYPERTSQQSRAGSYAAVSSNSATSGRWSLATTASFDR